MIPNDVQLWLGNWLVPAADMINTRCANCADPLDWKHDIEGNVFASCCGVVYAGKTHGKKGTIFHVNGKKTDPTNIVLFPSRR